MEIVNHLLLGDFKPTPTPSLTALLRNSERNITAMAAWSWKKTAKHLDLIDQQLGMAFERAGKSKTSYSTATILPIGSPFSSFGSESAIVG